MVKENIIIPKEDFKKVEEVKKINTEIPTHEEFLKTYNADEEVNESYNFEVDSYKDIRINKSYGPGNSQLSEETAKYIGKQAASKAGLVLFSALPLCQ